MLYRDGTFTGIYKPPISRDADGIYNISVRLDRTTVPAPISLVPSVLESENSMRYAMPVDQCNSTKKLFQVFQLQLINIHI